MLAKDVFDNVAKIFVSIIKLQKDIFKKLGKHNKNIFFSS
jgi:hypothetical protein